MENKIEPDIQLVITTFPSIEIARQIGTALVESQLIACINLIPKVESIYQWKGKVETEAEVVGLMKTTKSAVESLKKELATQHPYDVPEMIVIPLLDGLPGYLSWVEEAVLR